MKRRLTEREQDDKEHDNHERRPISSFLAEKEGIFDQNMLLAMIANQNRNDDSMNDYIKNAINKKFKVD